MALRWGRERCLCLDRADRCTVDEHRPPACREHPFTITLSERGAVQGLRLSKASECLYELDGQVTRTELAAVSRWNEEESDEYQDQVRPWNRHSQPSRTRAAFLEFLGLEWDHGSQLGKSSRPHPAHRSPFGQPRAACVQSIGTRSRLHDPFPTANSVPIAN